MRNLVGLCLVALAGFSASHVYGATPSAAERDSAFITEWVVEGASNDPLTIKIPVYNPPVSHDAGYKVYWGDGTVDDRADGWRRPAPYYTPIYEPYQHTYSEAGTYEVVMVPGGDRTLSINFLNIAPKHAYKLREIKQWGDTRWHDLKYGFYGAKNLKISATIADAPDLSRLNHFWGEKSLEYMFAHATSLANLNGRAAHENDTGRAVNPDIVWDVSEVRKFNGMFSGATNFADSLGHWDVGSATDMSDMFDYSGMRVYHYHRTLSGWAEHLAARDQGNNGMVIGAKGVRYCPDYPARQALIEAGIAFDGDQRIRWSGCTHDVISELSVHDKHDNNVALTPRREKASAEMIEYWYDLGNEVDGLSIDYRQKQRVSTVAFESNPAAMTNGTTFFEESAPGRRSAFYGGTVIDYVPVGDSIVTLRLLNAQGQVVRPVHVFNFTRAPGDGVPDALNVISAQSGEVFAARRFHPDLDWHRYSPDTPRYITEVDKLTHGVAIAITPAHDTDTVTMSTQHPRAQFSGNEFSFLPNGDIWVDITVVDKFGGDVREYALMIRRPPSGIAALTDLGMTSRHAPGSIDPVTPAFDPEVYEYNVEVRDNVGGFTLRTSPWDSAGVEMHVAESPDPRMVISQSKANGGVRHLPHGKSVIAITVTSSDRSASVTYTLTIERELNRLASLEYALGNDDSSGVLTPEFDGGIFDYEVTIPSYIETIDITAQPLDPDKGVLCLYGPSHFRATHYGCGDSEYLGFGANTIKIVVYPAGGSAQSDKGVLTYRLTVNRELPKLTSLSLAQHRKDGQGVYHVMPALGPDINTYRMTVPADLNRGRVFADLQHPEEHVSYAISSDSPFASGDSDNPLYINPDGRFKNLPYGDSTLEVTVHSADYYGYSRARTYSITITRPTLEVNGFALASEWFNPVLSPAVSDGVYTYTITVPDHGYGFSIAPMFTGDSDEVIYDAAVNAGDWQRVTLDIADDGSHGAAIVGMRGQRAAFGMSVGSALGDYDSDYVFYVEQSGNSPRISHLYLEGGQIQELDFDAIAARHASPWNASTLDFNADVAGNSFTLHVGAGDRPDAVISFTVSDPAMSVEVVEYDKKHNSYVAEVSGVPPGDSTVYLVSGDAGASPIPVLTYTLAVNRTMTDLIGDLTINGDPYHAFSMDVNAWHLPLAVGAERATIGFTVDANAPLLASFANADAAMTSRLVDHGRYVIYQYDVTDIGDDAVMNVTLQTEGGAAVDYTFNLIPGGGSALAAPAEVADGESARDEERARREELLDAVVPQAVADSVAGMMGLVDTRVAAMADGGAAVGYDIGGEGSAADIMSRYGQSMLEGTMDYDHLIDDMSFNLSVGRGTPAGVGRSTDRGLMAFGDTHVSPYNMARGDSVYDGTTRHTVLGLDYASGHALHGLGITHTERAVDYAYTDGGDDGDGGGSVGHDMAGVNYYAGLRLTGSDYLWTTLLLGEGEVAVDNITTETRHRSVGFGGRFGLASGALAENWRLSLRPDAVLTSVDVAAVDADEDDAGFNAGHYEMGLVGIDLDVHSGADSGFDIGFATMAATAGGRLQYGTGDTLAGFASEVGMAINLNVAPINLVVESGLSYVSADGYDGVIGDVAVRSAADRHGRGMYWDVSGTYGDHLESLDSISHGVTLTDGYDAAGEFRFEVGYGVSAHAAGIAGTLTMHMGAFGNHHLGVESGVRFAADDILLGGRMSVDEDETLGVAIDGEYVW